MPRLGEPRAGAYDFATPDCPNQAMAPLRHPRKAAPPNRYTHMLWTRSPRGRRTVALEERELRRVLPEFFGRYCVQVGSWGQGGELMAGAATLHRLVLGTVRDSGNHAQIETDRVPLLSKSVDTMILAHALEFAHSPHHLLREADRVLTDRGALMILGFNPWSLWGLRNRLGPRYRAFPDSARFIAAGRLCDWLELLDFEVTELRRFGPGSSWWRPLASNWLSTMADNYIVVARKRVLPMTMIGKPVRAKIAPILGGIAVPDARSSTPDV